MDSGVSEGPAAFMKRDSRFGGAGGQEALTADFLRKYIIYARRRCVCVCVCACATVCVCGLT